MLIDDFNFEDFVRLVDNIYDEVCIWDADMRVVYFNKACYRHYGKRPEEFVGKTLDELMGKEKLWYPSSVPDTINSKRPYIQKQRTFLGYEITTISVPIFDSHDNVKYIVQTCREDEKNLFNELTPLLNVEKRDEEHGCEMIFSSAQMTELAEEARIVAMTKAPVLILGETGTGKTLIARYIHEHSDRADKPFVNINMASLNPNLIESEFFGYKKGAFTGASDGGKKGILEMANGGTLFLDEIGDFPCELQAKFLSVLQDEEFVPVGGTTPIKLDIRIISATNNDITKMIEAGKFRKDMYHRLNTIELTVPPLRERPEDILTLSSFFLKKFNAKYKRHAELSDEVIDIFENYSWTGNIRELSNVIERGIIRAANGIIRMNDLPESFFSVDNRLNRSHNADDREINLTEGFDSLMENHERRIVTEAYKKYPSSRKLAQALGITQTRATKLIKKHLKNE